MTFKKLSCFFLNIKIMSKVKKGVGVFFQKFSWETVCCATKASGWHRVKELFFTHPLVVINKRDFSVPIPFFEMLKFSLSDYIFRFWLCLSISILFMFFWNKAFTLSTWDHYFNFHSIRVYQDLNLTEVNWDVYYIFDNKSTKINLYLFIGMYFFYDQIYTKQSKSVKQSKKC